MSKKDNYQVEFIYRPGRTLAEDRQRRLVAELRDCAATCFDEIPDYQVFRGT